MTAGSLAEDIIFINPIILKEDNVHEKNRNKNITLSYLSLLYPILPILLVLYRHA
jgi:hypothetical protein